MKSIPLLVSSRGHAPTRKQIVDLFDTSSLDDIEKMDAEQRAAIRGVGCLFDALGRKQFDLLPNLEIVSSFGVGYDQIDAKAAAERGVIVTHTPGVLDDEVADTALGLLLSTLRELPRAETYLRDGNWITEGPYPLSRLTLRGRKIGIFGMGRIGTAIARRLEGFGVSIAYHNRSKVPDCTYQYFSSLMELASSVDTLINVAPATGQTQNAVDSKILQALGPNGVFINIGRGATVAEDELARALHDGTIAAAGLDVYANEPNVHDQLLTAPNTVLLPHIASASVHTRAAMGQLVVDNLVGWFTERSVMTPVPETLHLVENRSTT